MTNLSLRHNNPIRAAAVYILLLLLVILSVIFSLIRNRVYQTGLTLWKDCAEKTEWQDLRSVVSYATHLAMQRTPESQAEASRVMARARLLEYKSGRYSLDAVKSLILNHLHMVAPEDRREIMQFVLETIDPLDSKLLEMNALSYLLEGDLDNARAAASLLNRISPDPASKVVMGRVYNAHGCYQKAERDFFAAIAIERNVPRWHEVLLENSLCHSDPEESRELFRAHRQDLAPTVLKRFEDHWSDAAGESAGEKVQLARLDVLQWEYGAAGKALKRLAREATVLNSETLKAMLHMLMRIKDFETAESVLQRIEKAEPGAFANIMLRSEYHQAREEWDTCALLFGQAADMVENEHVRYILKRKQGIAQREASHDGQP
ncbi:tetratricopeptide repeat protein [Planctomycetota bacterium]